MRNTKALEWINKIQEKVENLLENECQDWVEIPDANFRTFLKGKYPTCFNSQDMLDTTCSAVLTARKIDCSWQSLTNLHGIQYFERLEILKCNNNQLTSLPVLPSGLKYLNCWDNNLTSLPVLPSTLNYLSCFSNQLTSLPSLPDGLKVLNIDNNNLTSLLY